VDMIAPVGVLIAAAAFAAPAAPMLDPLHLPALPTRGITLQLRTGVRLETMQGRPIGVLRGLFPAPDKAAGSGLIMRDRRGPRCAVLGRTRLASERERSHSLPERCVRRSVPSARDLRRASCRQTEADTTYAVALCVVLDVGRLALLFGDARVDRAVELVLLQLALDVGL
jgi:hypothetical protein